MVALPADWIRGHDLKSGNEVDISYDDREVRVRPRERTEPTKESP